MRILFFLITINILFSQNVSKIEPPNWWAGMKYENVQLLLYGKDLKDSQIQTKYPGVVIKKIDNAESPNYLFVTVDFSKAKAGKISFELSKNNKIFQTIFYELKTRLPNSANRESFSTADAIYLIVPDRFANGITTNDNTEDTAEKLNREFIGGRHGGDIKGIENNLDYIKEMGWTTIWPTPLLENDSKEYSYHGYGATDYYKIDSRFGTNEDYNNLVKKSHSKGLKFIQDFIFNHCGINHWWMTDLPFNDWVNKWDKFTATNHKKSVIIDPYAAEIDKKTYVNGWFVDTMPDLNQKNPFLAKYLIQNTLWWIEESGIDGIRVDTYSYSDKDFLKNWNEAVQNEYPNFNVVAEEWIRNPISVSYWQKGQKNKDGFDSKMPMMMDFALGDYTIKALNEPNNSWSSSWGQVYESLGNDYIFSDPNNLMIFPDNHDMDRIYTSLKENFAHWKIAMALFSTTRGMPQFLYGSELLASNKEQGNHGQIRSDFPGGWATDSKNGFTQQGLTEQEKEAQNFLKTILNFRKSSEAIKNGTLLHYSPDVNDVYIYFRKSSNQNVMVLLSKNDKEVNLDLSKYSQGLNGSKSGNEIISGKTISLDKNIIIPPKGVMIIDLK